MRNTSTWSKIQQVQKSLSRREPISLPAHLPATQSAPRRPPPLPISSVSSQGYSSRRKRFFISFLRRSKGAHDARCPAHCWFPFPIYLESSFCICSHRASSFIFGSEQNSIVWACWNSSDLFLLKKRLGFSPNLCYSNCAAMFNGVHVLFCPGASI